jgi:hypothetical protein
MDETQPAAKPKKETKIEKKLFLWLAILVVIWLVFSIAAQNLAGGNGTDTNANLPPTTAPQGSGKETVAVIIKATANSTTVLDKAISVEKGTNGLEAMKQADPKLGYKESPGLGGMVESINGTAAGAHRFWALYVNGQISDVGISSITITENTLIEWKALEFE